MILMTICLIWSVYYISLVIVRIVRTLLMVSVVSVQHFGRLSQFTVNDQISQK